MKSIRLLFLLTTLSLLISCSKDDTTDPKSDSSVSVIYSDWLDVKFEADKDGDKILGYYAGLQAPKITDELLTSGEVKVYINLSTAADPVIVPLPYIGTNGTIINFNAQKQAIEFYSNIDVSTYVKNDGGKYLQYRYILMPGTEAARKSQSINWNKYAEVKSALNLPD
ncbi:hypothetical protein QNI19_30025 [Cytophagaceae bacterium DM2B3-1]|uniref:Lipoprotein n=1 Tax=Xanthocytophaga flava TaxID=3048013 RepID=A0ABT7CX75_9BACT|nr:hypothetical protein [Xanthocytophaga flavus]MDJ1497214.1 hypothetical protein [Xanthocytophaga flavus]